MTWKHIALTVGACLLLGAALGLALVALGVERLIYGRNR